MSTDDNGGIEGNEGGCKRPALGRLKVGRSSEEYGRSNPTLVELESSPVRFHQRSVKHQSDSAMSNTLSATYPHAWRPELIRNASGRAFWFVSRFISRTLVEYIENVSGEPECYRLERLAVAAAAKRNAHAAQLLINGLLDNDQVVNPPQTCDTIRAAEATELSALRAGH